MKLSNAVAKLTSGNIKVLSVLGGLALAGAAFTLAAPAASAQQFGIGVEIGGPRYVVPVAPPVYRPYGYYAPQPVYVAPRYWDHGRVEAWRAHEDWDRDHVVYGRPAPYRGYDRR